MKILHIKVTNTHAGLTVLRFVTTYLSCSYAEGQKLIRTAQVRVNKKRCKFNSLLTLGDTVRVPLGLPSGKREEAFTQRAKSSFEQKLSQPSWRRQLSVLLLELLTKNLLYEDQSILAINKPRALPVQGGKNIKISLDDTLPFLPYISKLGRRAKYSESSDAKPKVKIQPKLAALPTERGEFASLSPKNLRPTQEGAFKGVSQESFRLAQGRSAPYGWLTLDKVQRELQRLVSKAAAQPFYAPSALLSSLKGQSYKIVHRLDKETTGVLIFAKTPSAAKELSRLFQQRSLEKSYRCLCWLNEDFLRDTPRCGVVDQSLQRASGGLNKVNIASPSKSAVQPSSAEESGPGYNKNSNPLLAATTYYAIEKIFELDPSCCKGELSTVSGVKTRAQSPIRLAYVKVNPVTGRYHQIRAHMAYLGMPIVGDYKYGYQDQGLPFQLGKNQVMLHARSLSFNKQDFAKDCLKTADGHLLNTDLKYASYTSAPAQADARAGSTLQEARLQDPPLISEGAIHTLPKVLKSPLPWHSVLVLLRHLEQST